MSRLTDSIYASWLASNGMSQLRFKARRVPSSRGDGGYAPHVGAAVAVAPITSRGAVVDDSLNGPARHVKPDVLDSWIISACQ